MGMTVGIGQGDYRVRSCIWKKSGAAIYGLSSLKEGLISSMYEVTQGDHFYQ